MTNLLQIFKLMRTTIWSFFLCIVSFQIFAQGNYTLKSALNEPNPDLVRELSISSSADGHVPILPDLSRFKNLVKLSINQPKLGGLPASIGNLENLKVLVLDNCEKIVDIPNSFSKLKLEEFRAWNCSNLGNLSPLTNMSTLKIVVFENEKSHISPDAMFVENLINLEILTLRVSKGVSLSKLNKLRVLNTGDYLPSSLCNLQSLESISVSQGAYVDIPDCLGKIPKLKEIDLRLAEFTKSEIKELKKQYPHLKIYHQYGDQK
jgi:Leucine-rich repeat (LRR) protein